MKLSLQPISFPEACAFVRSHHREEGRAGCLHVKLGAAPERGASHHRHQGPPQGWKFSLALNDGWQVVGLATVGRPVARHQDDGLTLEVTRVCVLDGTPGDCRVLYAAAWRAARAGRPAPHHRHPRQRARREPAGRGLAGGGPPPR